MKAIVENISYLLTRFHRRRRNGETSPVLWIAYFCWNTFKRIRSAIILGGYGSDTIAAYFRKQGAQIGYDCDIRITSVGPEPYLVSIGNHVMISKGVEFHSHDGGVWILRDKVPDIRVHGPIIIEDNCIIGVNTILQPNIRIGRNSIIGANSVVISDIPPNSIAMGIPARIYSSISKYEEKCITKWNEQKPPDLNTEKGNEWWRFEENRQKLRVHLTSLSKDDINAGERLIDKQARAEN